MKLILVALASFAAGLGVADVCLSSSEVRSCASALDASDETVDYIFWGVANGNITPEQMAADTEFIHTSNNDVRYFLGIPQK